MVAKDTKPYGVSQKAWEELWYNYPDSMRQIYDISQELPGCVGLRQERINRIVNYSMVLNNDYQAAVTLWRDELLKKEPAKENYYPGPGEGASPKLVKLFYKRIRELVSIYNDLGQAADPDSEEDLSSRYYGIATGLGQIENYMSNHEPWNVNHLILEMVIEQHKINRTQEANKNTFGFNMVFSKGEEEALMILRRELIPLFLPPTRQIVVCKG
jgi:hypothetical protein